MAPISPSPSAATATADTNSLAQSLLVALAQWQAAAQASSSGSEPGPADIPHPTAATTTLSSWTTAPLPKPGTMTWTSSTEDSAAAVSDWLQQQLAGLDIAGTMHLDPSPPEATIAKWWLWDKVFWVIGVAAVWIIGCLGLWGVLAAVVSQERRRGDKANGVRVIEDGDEETNGRGDGEFRREGCSQHREDGNLQSRNGERATVQTSHAPPEGGNSAGIRDGGLMQTQAEDSTAETAPAHKAGVSQTNGESEDCKAGSSVQAAGNNPPPIDNLGRDRYQAVRDLRLYGVNDAVDMENGKEPIEPSKSGSNLPQSQNTVLDTLGRDRHQLARDLLMYSVHTNNTEEDALLSTGPQPQLPMHKSEIPRVDNEDNDDDDNVEQNHPHTSDLEAKITEYKAQIHKSDGGSQPASPSLPKLASTFIRLKAKGKVPMGATFDEFKRLREKVGREGGQAQGSDLNNNNNQHHHHHQQSCRTIRRFKSAWADKCSLVPPGSKTRRRGADDVDDEEEDEEADGDEDQVAGEDDAQELATPPFGAYTLQLPALRCAPSSTCLLAIATPRTTTTGTERRMTPESLTPRSDYNGEGWSVTASEAEAGAADENNDSFVGGDDDDNDDDDSEPEDQQRVNEQDSLIPESAGEMLAQMVRRVDRRWW